MQAVRGFSTAKTCRLSIWHIESCQGRTKKQPTQKRSEEQQSNKKKTKEKKIKKKEKLVPNGRGGKAVTQYESGVSLAAKGLISGALVVKTVRTFLECRHKTDPLGTRMQSFSFLVLKTPRLVRMVNVIKRVVRLYEAASSKKMPGDPNIIGSVGKRGQA